MSDVSDPLIDAALNSYPLAPLPPGFSRRVVAHLIPAGAAALPAYRLSILDFAIPAFLALVGALALGVFLYSLPQVDPLLLARLRLELLLLTQRARLLLNLESILAPALLASGLALGVFGALVGLAANRQYLPWGSDDLSW